MIIPILIALAVLTAAYIGTAIETSGRAFNKPKELQEKASKAEANNSNLKSGKLLYKDKRSTLAKEWDEYTRWPRITAKPPITLKEFDGNFNYAAPSEAEIDAARAQAYRRMFWSPVWPLMLVGDVYRGYQKAKAGERVYLLEQSTKALEKALADKPDLEAAYNKAEDLLKKVAS